MRGINYAVNGIRVMVTAIVGCCNRNFILPVIGLCFHNDGVLLESLGQF